MPASVDVTVTLLSWTPAATPVTFTESIQAELAARVAPCKLTEPAPAIADGVPLQLVVRPAGDDTTSPAGRLSVKATPVSATTLAAGLTRLKVRAVEPFIGMVSAANASVITGGAATVRLAEAVPPARP